MEKFAVNACIEIWVRYKCMNSKNHSVWPKTPSPMSTCTHYRKDVTLAKACICFGEQIFVLTLLSLLKTTVSSLSKQISDLLQHEGRWITSASD